MSNAKIDAIINGLPKPPAAFVEWLSGQILDPDMSAEEIAQEAWCAAIERAATLCRERATRLIASRTPGDQARFNEAMTNAGAINQLAEPQPAA